MSAPRLRADLPNWPSIIGHLEDAAIAVDEIGLRRPTLDEVFLMLTGEVRNSSNNSSNNKSKNDAAAAGAAMNGSTR